MNFVEKYYKKEFGSVKGYLFLLMQVAVILAIVISILAAMYKNYFLLVLEIIPAAIISYSLFRIKKQFKPDFIQSSVLFTILFIVALIGPFAIRTMIAADPLGSVNYIFCAIIVFLILFIVLKSLASRNFIKGKVLLADKNTAVVQFDFDLFTGIKAGKYVVKNRGARKGQTVKVKIKKGIFRKTEPVEVVK